MHALAITEQGTHVHVKREISDANLIALREMVLKEIDPTEDTVRLYHLCARCIPATEVLGIGVYVERGDADEVL